MKSVERGRASAMVGDVRGRELPEPRMPAAIHPRGTNWWMDPGAPGRLAGGRGPSSTGSWTRQPCAGRSRSSQAT